MLGNGQLLAGMLLISLALVGSTWSDATAGPMQGALSLSGNSPVPLVPVSVTFPSAADAFIDSLYPDRNTGGSGWVAVGADPGMASAQRGLFQFNVTGIPATATILDATLRAYASQGSVGQLIDVHRLRAPWIEGSGSGFSYRQAFTLTETANVSRILEPVDLLFPVPIPYPTIATGDFYVFDEQGAEVPSQVYGVQTDATGNVTQLHIVFGATVGALQSRTFYVYFGNLLPSVPVYRQPAAPSRLWSFGAPVRYAPLNAADLDGDGLLEVVIASSAGFVVAIRPDGSVMWNHTAADSVDNFAVVADVDGDGVLEALYATGGTDNKIYALDGRTGFQEWRSQVPTASILAPGAVADTDGDGVKEIYFGSSDGNVYSLYGLDGTTRWAYPLGGTYLGLGAAIGDVIGGPEPEVVFTVYVPGQGDILILRPDGTFVSRFSPTAWQIRVSPSLGNFDADPHLDIVASDAAPNGAQYAIRASDQFALYFHTTNSDMYGGQVLVDFEDDGVLETAFSMTKRGIIRAIGSAGNALWNATTGNDVWGSLSAADVDLDGVEEILGGSFDANLYVIDSAGSFQTFSFDTAQMSATPIAADLNGDGRTEVVFASRAATYALTFPSLGHDFRTWGYNHNRTGRFLDGNSPDGAPLLQPSPGSVESLSGGGVTWRSRDGTLPWANPGSDYDATIDASTTVGGSSQWLTWNVTSIVQSWTSGAQPMVGLLAKSRTEAVAATTTILSREGDPSFSASLSVLYVNDVAPAIAPQVPDQRGVEDGPLWTLDLLGFASDPDTPLSRLRWDLLGANTTLYDFSGGNITGNHRLAFLPKPNAWGNDGVTLFLFDDAGNYATQPLWINITPVNDAPYWDGPPTTLYVKYGTSYTFDFDPYIKDIDTPRSTLRLRTDDATHTSVSGFRVTFTYPSNYPDQWDFVILTVDDGALAASESIAVRLTTDTPPELRTPLPDVTLMEGESVTNVFDLDDYFVDPDNDILFFSYGFSQVTVTIIDFGLQPRLHQVDMEALGEWYGIESVTFRATDPTGAIIEDTILVTVIPVNDPPILDPTPPWVVHYDVPYAFDLTPYVHDSDNDLGDISITTNRPGNITVSGMVLTFLFPQVLGALVAPYTIPLTIFASDGINTTFRVTTVEVTDDYPPQLRNGTQLPDVTFFEDEFLADYFDLDLYFEDTDSATIFYYSGPENITVGIDLVNHTVDFSAPQDWFGGELVTFRATDDRGAYAEDTIKVTVRPVNDAPYFLPLPVLRSSERTFFWNVRNYTVDVERDPLQITSSSSHIVVQTFLLIFSYPEGVYEEEINLTVSDGKGGIGYAILRVEIDRPNLFLALLPWIVAAGVAGLVFLATRVLRSIVEEVFLIYQSGVPIMHLSRSLTSDKDPDLVASMFTAIQSFMNTSFQSMGVGDVRGIELADHNVAVARGSYVSLVVLYRGRESGRLEKRANEIVEDIEKKYRSALKDWNGDLDRLAGVKQMLERMWGAKRPSTNVPSQEPSPPEIEA